MTGFCNKYLDLVGAWWSVDEWDLSWPRLDLCGQIAQGWFCAAKLPKGNPKSHERSGVSEGPSRAFLKKSMFFAAPTVFRLV